MRRLRCLCALALLAAGPAAAHDARPVSITLLEQAPGLYRAIVRVPPTVEAGNRPRIVWPARCEAFESAPLATGDGSLSLLRCTGGLAAQTLGIDFPLYNPSLTALIRIETLGGEPVTAVLPPDQSLFTVPAAPTFAGVARDYLGLGFAHIWAGIDHLLFVAGLMLLARTPRRTFWAVTGFTAAHSLTLALATTGLVRPPVEPVEALIALSIVFLAAEIARGNAASLSCRFPVALAFVFGLLHGFGFASALGEAGLPRGALAAGLAFFNIGVELGQLAFIAAVALPILAWRQMRPQRKDRSGRAADAVLPAGVVTAAAYALGIPAAWWFIERSSIALGA